MPIPDSCLRFMVSRVKMICSRFTAEWLENKGHFSASYQCIACEQAPTGLSWEQGWGGRGVRGRGRERPGAGTCSQAISMPWSPYRVLPFWWPPSPDSHFPGRIGDKVQMCWHTSRQSQMQIKLHPTGKRKKLNQTQFKIQQSSQNGQQKVFRN